MKEKIIEKAKAFLSWIKEKTRIAWAWTKDAFSRLVTFVKQNPLVTVAFLGLLKTVINNSSRIMSMYNDKQRHDRGFYDKRRGRWSYAKKTPSHYQLDEIEWRYQNGESYRSILEDMHLLKGR